MAQPAIGFLRCLAFYLVSWLSFHFTHRTSCGGFGDSPARSWLVSEENTSPFLDSGTGGPSSGTTADHAGHLMTEADPFRDPTNLLIPQMVWAKQDKLSPKRESQVSAGFWRVGPPPSQQRGRLRRTELVLTCVLWGGTLWTAKGGNPPGQSSGTPGASD